MQGLKPLLLKEGLTTAQGLKPLLFKEGLGWLFQTKELSPKQNHHQKPTTTKSQLLPKAN